MSAYGHRAHRRTLTIVAHGTPKGQGNHRRNQYGATYEATKGHGPWRRAVIAAARAWSGDGAWEPYAGPVSVLITFQFGRPASHYGTGRNSDSLRPNAAPLPTSGRVGDLDKHVRTILDALTAADVIVDDRLVVHIDASKRWCLTGEKPGATITVREAL